jgi:hypothetical protein
MKNWLALSVALLLDRTQPDYEARTKPLRAAQTTVMTGFSLRNYDFAAASGCLARLRSTSHTSSTPSS